MEKSLSFIILIFVGVLFRNKINNKEQLGTIKTLILTIALPAVIVSALLKINLTASLIYPPLLVIAFNFFMFLSVRFLLPLFIKRKVKLRNMRTLMLMLPSLAPYLSCFPFLAEFADQSTVGMAAIADAGNKLFILLFLYFLAMYWAYGKKSGSKKSQQSQKGNALTKVLAVLFQPINLTLIIGLTASIFGYQFDSLPFYVQDSLAYLRNLLTPTILIFIGLAVKVKGQELQLIAGFLIWRSAVSFFLSALLLWLLPLDSLSTALLLVAFPQSSCSFLPYAHMSMFSDMNKGKKKIFNQTLGLSLLAISLPFSSFTIISVFSFADFFSSSWNLMGLSLAGFVLSGFLLRHRAYRKRPATSVRRRQLKASV